VGTGRGGTSPPAAVERMRAAAALTSKGIGVLDADTLLKACADDDRLVMVVIPLPGVPRVGDRVRVKMPNGVRTLRVEALAEASPTRRGQDVSRRWAVVGLPVESSARDDVASTAPVRRPR
jgi:hypothetical protein